MVCYPVTISSWMFLHFRAVTSSFYQYSGISHWIEGTAKTITVISKESALVQQDFIDGQHRNHYGWCLKKLGIEIIRFFLWHFCSRDFPLRYIFIRVEINWRWNLSSFLSGWDVCFRGRPFRAHFVPLDLNFTVKMIIVLPHIHRCVEALRCSPIFYHLGTIY